MRHHANYDVCPFCNNVVEADLAGTADCPLCLQKEKTCTECGETKELKEFNYNPSKDSLDYDDPRNDICLTCQGKKAAAKRETAPKPKRVYKPRPKKGKSNKLSPKEHEILKLAQRGLNTREIAHRLNSNVGTVGGYKSRGLKKLEAQGIELKNFDFD